MNRYEEFLIKYSELLNNKKYEEAKLALNELLNTEYVPQEYYQRFNLELKKIELLIKQNYEVIKKEKFVANLTKDDLFTYIINNHKVDIHFLNLYLDKFKTIDDKNQITTLQFTLDREDIKQDDKFALLVFLLKRTKHTYYFYNAIFKVRTKIDQSFLANYNVYNSELNNFLNKLVDKDVTISTLSKQVINLINTYYFPSFPYQKMKISVKELATKIYQYVIDTFNNNENNSFSKIFNYFEQ